MKTKVHNSLLELLKPYCEDKEYDEKNIENFNLQSNRFLLTGFLYENEFREEWENYVNVSIIRENEEWYDCGINDFKRGEMLIITARKSFNLELHIHNVFVLEEKEKVSIVLGVEYFMDSRIKGKVVLNEESIQVNLETCYNIFSEDDYKYENIYLEDMMYVDIEYTVKSRFRNIKGEGNYSVEEVEKEIKKEIEDEIMEIWEFRTNQKGCKDLFLTSKGNSKGFQPLYSFFKEYKN